MKKILLVALCAMLCCCMVFGCAKTEPATDGAAAEAPKQETEEAPADDETQAEEPASSVELLKVSGYDSDYDPSLLKKIGVSFDAITSPWWTVNLGEMQRICDMWGVELVSVMCEGDPTVQQQQIEQLIGQGCQAIIVKPCDASGIESSIKECKEAGVPIIMDNMGVANSVTTMPDLQVIAANEPMATAVMDEFAKLSKEEGWGPWNVILVDGLLSDDNGALRRSGHLKGIENNPDMYTLMTEVPSDWDLETCLKGMQNALQAYPEANLIVCPSDGMAPAITSALQQIDRWAPKGDDKHFTFLSFDCDPTGLQNMYEGYCEVNNSQDAVLEAQMIMEWAARFANGQKPDEAIIHDPGKLITYKTLDELGPDMWSYDYMEISVD